MRRFPVLYYCWIVGATGLTVCGLDHWNLGSSNPPAAFSMSNELDDETA